MSKLVASIKEAIEKCGLQDGMTISFHHHMRNGDYVLNMVLEQIAQMGYKNLTVNASSVFDVHEPIIGHIKNGVVTGIECNYMGAKVGKAISEGIMDKPVIFRSHGGRASDMEKAPPKLISHLLQLLPPMIWVTAPVNSVNLPAVPSAMHLQMP